MFNGKNLPKYCNLGENITKLPPYSPDNIAQYKKAIDLFFNSSSKDIQEQWNQLIPEKKKSNVACADCMMTRIKGLVDSIDQDVSARKKKNQLDRLIEDNIHSLAMCEHSRWNVEELILGYRPLADDERLTLRDLGGNERTAFIKNLKTGTEKAHIDICSFNTLRNSNEADLRYDYFLTLSISKIFRKELSSRLSPSSPAHTPASAET